MPGQTQIPLYSEIFVKCREISLLSRGADSQKSGKAIGEIAFENAGKNSIANSCAARKDFILAGARTKSPAEKTVWDISFSGKHGFCCIFLRTKNVPTPQKPSYLERSAQEWSGEKKGTP